MIGKKELREYRDNLLELRQIGERIEMLKTRIYCLHSPSLSGMPHAETVGSGSNQERAVDEQEEEISQLAAEYKRREAEQARDCLRIEIAIAELPARYRMIFRAHYIDGLKWQTVAEKYHFSIQRIMQLHGEGLKKLREKQNIRDN